MKKQELKEAFSAAAGLTIRREVSSSALTFKNLKLTRPDDGETLVDTFNFTLQRGERMIVTGPRGCGKSTLMRAIGGLWDSGEGEIVLPSDARILTVPQKPYLPDIPLRGILCYPDENIRFNDVEMGEALHTVGLSRLVPTLEDTEHTGAYWSSRLSLGEQQALVFARILLYKPDVLMVDEVSASLDEESEQRLYRTMLEKLPDATIISISHHPKMIGFHTLHAEIRDRNFSVKPVESAPAPQKHNCKI